MVATVPLAASARASSGRGLLEVIHGEGPELDAQEGRPGACQLVGVEAQPEPGGPSGEQDPAAQSEVEEVWLAEDVDEVGLRGDERQGRHDRLGLLARRGAVGHGVGAEVRAQDAERQSRRQPRAMSRSSRSSLSAVRP